MTGANTIGRTEVSGRDLLLAVLVGAYSLGWLAVLIIVTLETKTWPPLEYLGALALGAGGLVAVFEGEERLSRRSGRAAGREESPGDGQ